MALKRGEFRVKKLLSVEKKSIIQNQFARLTAMIPKETLWRFMGLLGRRKKFSPEGARLREPKKIEMV